MTDVRTECRQEVWNFSLSVVVIATFCAALAWVVSL